MMEASATEPWGTEMGHAFLGVFEFFTTRSVVPQWVATLRLAL